MEQTLGRRISSNRKRLGLTQDALAERLGITAQAISKWENDLSCPDITMLPKLAEIFDISTDELLGVEPKPIVHESEIVEEPASEGGHVLKGNCEIHWDNSKKDGITLAVGVLMVGTLYLLSKWLQWDVSFWGILWPTILLVHGLRSIFPKFSLFNFGLALCGGYFLIQNLGFWRLEIASELIFPICIVLFGLSLLKDALQKPKNPSKETT